MKNLDKTEQEINKTLAALEGIEKAIPRPFFYTRLEAKMQQRYAPLPQFAMRPAFIWASLALIFVVNISVVINYSQKSSGNEEQNLNTFASEYRLN
jgi:hypothetical protein